MRIVIDTIAHNLTAPAVVYMAGIRKDGKHRNSYYHGSLLVPYPSVLVCLADKESEWQQAIRVFLSSMNKSDAAYGKFTASVNHVVNGAIKGITPIPVSYCLLIFKPKALAVDLSGLSFNFEESK